MGLLYLTVLCVGALVFERNCAKFAQKHLKNACKTGYFSHSNRIFRSKFHFAGKIEQILKNSAGIFRHFE